MTVGNFTENIGTSSADNLSAQDLQILYGLNGNDSLTASLGVFNADFVVAGVGGPGDDTYTVRDDNTLFVFENLNSGSDSITATGIGFNSATSESLTIEGRHILIRDSTSNQEVILIDALLSGTRIESLRGSDGTFTFEQILAGVMANSTGDFTFQQLQNLGELNLTRLGISTNDIAAAITTIFQRQEDLLSMAQSVGDPHITTFDGLYYDFVALGDFTLVESLDTGLKIQVRQDERKAYGLSTVNTALATKVGDNQIELYAGESPQLEVNDVLLNLAPGETQLVGPGSISLVNSTHQNGTEIHVYTINYGNGEKVVTNAFTNRGGYLDPYVYLYDNQDIEGLLGNFDGIAGNDLVLGNGTVIPKPDNTLELNGAYADAWQVDANNLIFNDIVSVV